MKERFEKADLIFDVRAVAPSVDTKYKMTPRTLIERQQFIEEAVKKLMNRRGIIMGGFLTLWTLKKLRFLIPRGDLLIQDLSSLSRAHLSTSI
jgi:hypothetical protein